MIFVLDTNVLSETMKPAPSSAVASWLRKQPLRSLFTAAICQAEVLAGIAVLPTGRRRTELEALAGGIFNEDFHERVLPFDDRAAIRRPPPNGPAHRNRRSDRRRYRPCS